MIKIIAPYLILAFVVFATYYKFIIFGKIPFPGDLLVGSYSPWFDYYKIPIQNPLISDVFSQFFLWKYLAIDILKNWQWPLWNPYSFTGTPLLATYHSATLYPLNLLLLLPGYIGWGVFIFSSTLLAATNMYTLLGLWAQSKLARMTGAIIFAFGGLMTTWLELGTAVHAIAWLPLALFSIEKFWSTFKLRYLLLLIISSLMIVLAGNAQISTYSFILLPLYALINSLSKDTHKFVMRFLPIMAALAITILLAASQLFPSFELLQKSIRLTETYTEEFNFGLLPIKDILKFFMADFFGNQVTRNYWGFLNYSETSSFVGSLTLPLLLFSFMYLKRTRINLFFLALLSVSLMLSFNNPLSQTFYKAQIPLFTSSFASRVLFITNFAIAVLAAFSINQIKASGNQLNNFFKTTIWSWAMIIGVVLGIIFVYQIIQEILRIPPQKEYLEFYLKDKDFALSNFLVSMRNSLPPIGIISIFFVLFILIKTSVLKPFNKHKVFVVCLMLFIFIVLDLGRYFLKFNPFVPQSLIFPKTPALEYLKSQQGVFRIGREHAEVFPPNTWLAYNFQSLEGYDPLYLNQYAKFIHFLNGGDLRYGSSSRYAELSQKYNSVFIDAANVKYFIGIGRDRNGFIPGEFINYLFNEAGYKRVFQDKSAVILENPGVLERVHFASSFIVSPVPQTENLIMTDPNFNPKISVAITDDLKLKSLTGQGNAKIIKYSPNEVVVETQTNHEELLILADQFDEGWKAKIDGQDTNISRANLIFRAVKVPSGTHKVVFLYWPASFDIGLKISLVTALLIFLLSLAFVNSKKF